MVGDPALRIGRSDESSLVRDDPASMIIRATGRKSGCDLGIAWEIDHPQHPGQGAGWFLWTG